VNKTKYVLFIYFVQTSIEFFNLLSILVWTVDESCLSNSYHPTAAIHHQSSRSVSKKEKIHFYLRDVWFQKTH